MENEKLEAIIRKIKGLMAIAEDNANEEEAQSAFVMAQKMMMKYNIEQSAIQTTEEVSIVQGQGSAYKKLFWHEKMLFIIICENFRVKGYYNSKRTDDSYNKKTAVIFYGLDQDVKIAKEMYILAVEALEFYAKRFVDSFYEKSEGEVRSRSYTTELKNSYMRGFIDGLKEKMKAQRFALKEEYGLIVLTPKVVEDSYNELSKNFKKGKDVFVPSIEQKQAYLLGYEEGNEIDYTKSTINDDIV